MTESPFRPQPDEPMVQGALRTGLVSDVEAAIDLVVREGDLVQILIEVRNGDLEGARQVLRDMVEGDCFEPPQRLYES